MRIWSGLVARELLPLVDARYDFGRDLDEDFGAEDSSHSVSVAQVLASLLGTPDDDRGLLRVLSRSQASAPSGVWWTAVRVADDRLGVVCPSGVIESAGDSLAVVSHPERDRYTQAFWLPGVVYAGVAR